MKAGVVMGQGWRYKLWEGEPLDLNAMSCIVKLEVCKSLSKMDAYIKK